MKVKSIQFTNEEYKTLVRLVFMGEWVVNAFNIEIKGQPEYELSNKVFSESAKFGLEDWFNKFDSGEYEMKEEKIMEIIDDINVYNLNTFWETLPQLLANRDAEIIIQSNPAFKNVDFEDLSEDLEEIYKNEFEENGLTNLYLVDENPAELN